MESIREIDECARVAQRIGTRARVMLRVNPLLASRSYGLKMGGKPVQFGLDEEELPAAEARVQDQLGWLEFRGIHVYVGSQCFEPAGVVEATRNALRIVREVEQRSGLRCVKVNLGGGFGVSHGEERRELDLDALSKVLVPVLSAHRETTPWPRDRLRAGALPDGGVRHLRRRAWSAARRLAASCSLPVDGGLHHHLAASGTFGAALRSNFALRNLSHPQATPAVCSLAGPSCNPTDLLGIDVLLARPSGRRPDRRLEVRQLRPHRQPGAVSRPPHAGRVGALRRHRRAGAPRHPMTDFN